MKKTARLTGFILGMFCVSLLLAFPQRASCINIEELAWVDHMLKGNELFKAGKYEKAVENFRKVVSIKRDLWDAWFQLAQSYEKLGAAERDGDTSNYKQALAAYRNIPQDNGLLYEKVRYHSMKINKILYGKGHGAVLEPEELEWVSAFKHGKDALSAGKYDSAIAFLRNVADEKPDMYEVYLSIGYAYERKAEKAKTISEKVRFQDKALIEYGKIPHKKPAFNKRLKAAQSRMRDFYKNIYDFGVKLGQSRKELVAAVGKIEPWQEKSSPAHYPPGSVVEIYYPDHGVRLGLREGYIYSIKFGSNYSGIVYGIKINDAFKKIKFLYHGKEEAVMGSSKGVRVEDPDALFIFNDSDDFVDMIELYDPKVYGRWDTKLK